MSENPFTPGVRVCRKQGRGWSKPMVVAEVVKDAVNVGKVGCGTWMPCAKLVPESYVLAHRAETAQLKRSSMLSSQVLKLMADGKPRTRKEIAKELGVDQWSLYPCLSKLQKTCRDPIYTVKP